MGVQHWGSLKFSWVILELNYPQNWWIVPLTQELFSVVKNKSYIGGILFSGGLASWKNLPRDPRCLSVATNPPTGPSTLGVSDGPLGYYWNIFSLALVDCNLDTINCFQLSKTFILVVYCYLVVLIYGIINPGSVVFRVYQPMCVIDI